MKNKILLLILLYVLSPRLKAQLVFLPDTNWRNFLISEGLSSCISNDTLDASCPVISTITTLWCGSRNLTDISGIEYFTSLKTFNCQGNLLNNISALPDSLTELNCQGNNLVQLPSLPSGLMYLVCSTNHLTSLPMLPSGLVELITVNNDLTGLPALPQSLRSLDCYDNSLTSLPALPDSMETLRVSSNNLSGNFVSSPNLVSLSCVGNQITSFGPFPVSLRFLDCGHNPLGVLPQLPDSLETLYCSADGLTSIQGLPPILNRLTADFNSITSISSLPNSLKTIDLDYNSLSTLPSLPDSLEWFEVQHNQLLSLPPLPEGLEVFYCKNNLLTQIDSFPSSLEQLYCSNNLLNSLPASTPALRHIIADNNNIQSIGSLNDSLNGLMLNYNPISCLPPFRKINFFYISITSIRCLPQIITVTGTNTDVDVDTIPICGISSGCPFNWNISGIVNHDLNADCIIDSAENPLSGIPVKLDSSGIVKQICYTNDLGQYVFKATLGNYNVSIDTLSVPFNVNCPANAIMNFDLSVNDSIIDTLDFNMTCKLSEDFLVNSVNPLSRFSPGRLTGLQVSAGGSETFYNAACFNQSGSVELILSANVTYSSSAPGALVPTVNGNTLIWSVTDFSLIDPQHDFNVILLTDTNATVGDSVCFDVTILPLSDQFPSNNIVHECFPVRASFDPNEKTVSPSVADTSVDTFTFTVFFQNTGTAPAANIFILDTLDVDLDASTFEVIGSSHEVVTQLLPGNVLRFNYHTIELPDSTSDELNSHGFVKYRVRRNANTGAGTEITNTAHIYFDYNEAVVTNTVSVEIASPVGVENTIQRSGSIILYPNPATTSFSIESTSKLNSVEIFDVLGNKIYSGSEVRSNYLSISTSGFSKGVYSIRIKDENNLTTVKRIVVQ